MEKDSKNEEKKKTQITADQQRAMNELRRQIQILAYAETPGFFHSPYVPELDYEKGEVEVENDSW